MTKAEEKRREKARQLRYRKPVVLEFHWDGIQQQLQEIEEAHVVPGEDEEAEKEKEDEETGTLGFFDRIKRMFAKNDLT